MNWHLFQAAVVVTMALMIGVTIATAVLAARAKPGFTLLNWLSPFALYDWLNRVIERAQRAPALKADLKLARLTRFLASVMYASFAVTVLLMLIMVA